MGSRISRRAFITWSVVILGGLCFPNTLFAGPDITIIGREDVESFELQCTIMEVHAKSKYLIAAEKKIELANFRKGNQCYRTMLRDASGNTILLSSFKRGQWVFIRGFTFSDGRIKAREIYRLPGTVTRKDFHKYPFFEKVPVWEPEPCLTSP